MARTENATVSAWREMVQMRGTIETIGPHTMSQLDMLTEAYWQGRESAAPSYSDLSEMLDAWETFDGDDVSTFIQAWADKLGGAR